MPVKHSTEDVVSPAEKFVLMAGIGPSWRCRGWSDLATRGKGERAHLDALWREHRDELLEEAAAYGFVPHAKSGQSPTGAGFERWCERLRQRSEY